jgi:Papain family cysteine protease
MTKTYGELRARLARENLGWMPPLNKRDDEKLPTFSLGATTDSLVSIEDANPINFKKLGPSGNIDLSIRRLQRKFVSKKDLSARHNPAILRRRGFQDVNTTNAGLETPPDGGAAVAVDWRNRWGTNFITSIRDQNPCQACWAFAGTALVEAMVRIEDGLWTRLSEGDVHRGVGKTCPDLGNIGEVSIFFANNGLCDPGSWPWSSSSAPYAPTPDRNGRSVRGPAFTAVGGAQQCKDWIDTVGPLITWIQVYEDFWPGSGVYRRSTDPENEALGGHFMLIVGYSDTLGAWLCKNSWGEDFGQQGFAWVAYGDSDIDKYARFGLRNTNPDPWTKRRLHNGNLYESGNGAMNRNLEVMASNGNRVQHYWREGGPPFTWGSAHQFANDAAVCPTFIGTTFNRNLELIYLTNGNRLHHWWGPGAGSGPWNDGGIFGPTDCRGVPGFIQSDYGAPGNFEVVVLVSGGQLRHIWRDGAGWHDGVLFGANLMLSGASLIQSSYGTPHGNLECVAVRNDAAMQHFWRDEVNGMTWNTGVIFGSGVSSPPVMIQGQYGMVNEMGPHGNFELCVAVNGQIQHWWRANSGDMQWRMSAVFGNDIMAVAGLAQSQWGLNLEVIALKTNGTLQHYWRDGAGWHSGPIIGPA